jgi:hypothetical protein
MGEALDTAARDVRLWEAPTNQRTLIPLNVDCIGSHVVAEPSNSSSSIAI